MRSTTKESLTRLIWIRLVVITGLSFSVFYFSVVRPIGIPTDQLAVVLFTYACFALLTWLRRRARRTLSTLELTAQLLADILFYSLLLYLTAGASNPFVSCFLIPISIAAITLPRLYTFALSLVAILAYSLLFKYSIPIEALSPADHHGTNNLHLLGMWLNFIVSALIIVYFIGQMAYVLRLTNEELATQREEALRNEQLLALATLAAGTAHELGTPLNTMKLIVDDLPNNSSDEIRADVEVLKQQISVCRQTLSQLVITAEQAEIGAPLMVTVGDYFSALFDRWKLLHPNLDATIEFENLPSDKVAAFQPTITQSIMNLLNNAAEASPRWVEVLLTYKSNNLSLVIRDHGPGMSEADMCKLGEPIQSTKGSGMGLGLFLSQASLTRYGGSVQLANHNGGGLLTTVNLPVVWQ